MKSITFIMPKVFKPSPCSPLAFIMAKIYESLYIYFQRLNLLLLFKIKWFCHDWQHMGDIFILCLKKRCHGSVSEKIKYMT